MERKEDNKTGKSSSHVGVSLNKQTGKWRAYHYTDGKLVQIGSYPTEDEAVEARETFMATGETLVKKAKAALAEMPVAIEPGAADALAHEKGKNPGVTIMPDEDQTYEICQLRTYSLAETARQNLLIDKQIRAELRRNRALGVARVAVVILDEDGVEVEREVYKL